MARKRELTKHPALYTEPLVFKPVVEWKEEALGTMQGIVPMAVKELRSLVETGTPDQVKLQAIRLLMQVVGLGEVNQEVGKTPLTVNVGMFNVDGKSMEKLDQPNRPI